MHTGRNLGRLVLIGVLLMPLVSCAFIDEMSAMRTFKDANVLYGRGDYEGSVIAYGEVLDLLATRPSPAQLDASDIVLLGGSGDYSATGEGEWLDRSLDVLCELVDRRQPTFASCWGFQAMARALGGTVVRDPDTAEVGTHQLFLTEAGSANMTMAIVAIRQGPLANARLKSFDRKAAANMRGLLGISPAAA